MIALAPARTRKKPGWRAPADRGRYGTRIDDSPVVKVYISMTKRELERIDAFASRVHMNRSELLRQCAVRVEDMLILRGGVCDD